MFHYILKDRLIVRLVFFLLSATAQISIAQSIPPAYISVANDHAVPADIWFAILQQESCIPLQNEDVCLP